MSVSTIRPLESSLVNIIQQNDGSYLFDYVDYLSAVNPVQSGIGGMPITMDGNKVVTVNETVTGEEDDSALIGGTPIAVRRIGSSWYFIVNSLKADSTYTFFVKGLPVIAKQIGNKIYINA